MRHLVLIFAGASALLAMPAKAAPGDMSVAVFLAKAEKLKAQGMTAMFSSDLKVVKAEAEGAGDRYRERLAADRKAGRAPHSCPPPEGKASINADKMIAHLRSYRSAGRGSVPMKTAFADLMRKEYPCS